MRADDFLNEGAEDRKRNALWAQITDYEKRAKATKNDIKKNHLLKMADDLRAKLPTNEEKVRLDPKCWTGKKIGNPKTKMKGGVRVNNCVPAESVAEGDVITHRKTDYPGYPGGNGSEFQKNPDKLDKTGTGRLDKAFGVKWEPTNKRKEISADPSGVAEDFDAEYDDEAGMAQGSLHTLKNAVEGLQQVIDSGDNLPEWCQEKISLAEDYLVTVWDYLQSEKAQGVDPELNEEFDLIENIIDRIAAQNGVESDVVWTDLESLTEDELYAFAVTSQLNEDWQKANKSDRTDGMSRKAVKAYRRAHPGSKLQTAVTTKPSKLKRGSKASKRRKSYCSRSKGQMNMHNISCAKTPDKAICKARRRWNC